MASSYKYKAMLKGTFVEGKISAENSIEAEAKLLSQDLTIFEIVELPETSRDVLAGMFKKGVKKKHLAIWARQFATMTKSGLPTIKSLETLIEQGESDKLKLVTSDMKDRIEAGESLSGAMEHHERVFGNLIISMVRAGEAGGFLEKSLNQVAKNLESEVKLRSQIKQAMTYPLVVLGLTVLLVSAMLIFVVPIFDNMFSSMGGELPMATKLLVMLSNVLKNGIIPIIIGVIGIAVWWKVNNRKIWVRKIVDKLKLKAPIFGTLFHQVALTRFSRTTSTLISSGVTLTTSLDIIGDSVGNIYIKEGVDNINEAIKEGEQMSQPMERQPDLFPPMLTKMVSVGEETGNIEEMLDTVADDYENQVNTTTQSLASIIEPLMITVLGVVIGGMVVALYLPIFQIYDLMK